MFYTKSSTVIRNDNNEQTTYVCLEKSHWQFERLEQITTAARNAKCKCLIIDISRVEQVTTATLAQLLLVKQQLQQKKIQMSLRGLQGQPKSLSDLVGLTEILCERSGSQCHPFASNDSQRDVA